MSTETQEIMLENTPEKEGKNPKCENIKLELPCAEDVDRLVKFLNKTDFKEVEEKDEIDTLIEQYNQHNTSKFWKTLKVIHIKISPVTIDTLRETEEVSKKGKIIFHYLLPIFLVAFISFFCNFYWEIGYSVMESINQIQTRADALLRDNVVSDLKEIKNKIETIITSTNTITTAGVIDVTKDISKFERVVELHENKTIKSYILSESFFDFVRFFSSTGGLCLYVEESLINDVNCKLTRDYTRFVLEFLQGLILPVCFGALGASIQKFRTLRKEIDTHTYLHAHFTSSNYYGSMLIGGIAGWIIGWIAIPHDVLYGVLSDELPTAQLPIVVGFLAGYSVELLFLALDKFIDSIKPHWV